MSHMSLAMRKSARSDETGQSLVLLAVLAVILLGIAGVALDGGWLVVQRRRAQNTADNAVMAAALKKAEEQPFVDEGMAVAAQNNYNNDGITNWVTVVSPPSDGAFAGNSAYVEATITQVVPTAFIQLVYKGPVQLTVRAVARALPSVQTPVVTGQAIVGLDKTACDTIYFSGTGNTHVTGGGILSNSTSPGQTCYSGRKSNASGSVIVDNGGINMVDDWNQNANATVNPGATLGVDQVIPNPVPLPPCDGAGMTDRGKYKLTNGSDTITPGRYKEIIVNPGAEVTMEPGLYCLTTGDFNISGDLTGIGVTIYMGPDAGAFSTNSGAAIVLKAPTAANCTDPLPTTPDVCDQIGMLLDVDPLNTNTVHVNGGADTVYVGTFYAPGALIDINGGSGTAGVFNSQIIGDRVQIEGNADLSIVYNPDQNYKAPIPPKVWLAE